jgi:hypothetical protein
MQPDVSDWTLRVKSPARDLARFAKRERQSRKSIKLFFFSLFFTRSLIKSSGNVESSEDHFRSNSQVHFLDEEASPMFSLPRDSISSAFSTKTQLHSSDDPVWSPDYTRQVRLRTITTSGLPFRVYAGIFARLNPGVELSVAAIV